MTINVSFPELVEVMRQTFNQPDIEIAPTTTASDVPGWDSLAHVTLMLEIEQTFGVTVSPVETAELPNVGALFDLIVKRAGRG